MLLCLEWEVVAAGTVNSSVVSVVGEVLPGPGLLVVQFHVADCAQLHDFLASVMSPDVITQFSQMKRQHVVEEVNADSLTAGGGGEATVLRTRQAHLPLLPRPADNLLPVSEVDMTE